MSIAKLFIPVMAMCFLMGACELGQTSSDKAPAAQAEQAKAQPAAASQIAVVDLGRAIAESEPGKQANAFIESIQNVYNEKLTAMQDKVTASKDSEKAGTQLEAMHAMLQQRFQQELQAVSSTVNSSAVNCLVKIREEQGYKVIVRSESVFVVDVTCDITAQVTAELNKMTLEFKPVTGDPAAIEVPDIDEAPAKEKDKKPAPDKKVKK